MTLDIDQYFLLTLYPTAAIFGIGFFAKKVKIREPLKYVLQASSSLTFSMIYFVLVPNGGAQGLVVVLFIFGILLLFMARKYMVHPEEEEYRDRPTNSANESL